MKVTAILVKKEGVRVIGKRRFANYLLIPFIDGVWKASDTVAPLTVREAYKFAKKRKYDLVECLNETFPEYWRQEDVQNFYDRTK